MTGIRGEIKVLRQRPNSDYSRGRKDSGELMVLHRSAGLKGQKKKKYDWKQWIDMETEARLAHECIRAHKSHNL